MNPARTKASKQYSVAAGPICQIGQCTRITFALLWLSCTTAAFAQLPGNVSVPSQPEAIPLEQALRLASAGDFPHAEEKARTFVLANPASADGHFLLAYTLLRENKPTESLAEYTNAAKLRAPSPEDLKNVALDYVLIKAYADAERWIALSLQMNPKDADGWYVSGRIYYEDKKYREAINCFEKALAIAPGNVKAENNLGLAYEELNLTDSAIAAYRQAIEWQSAAIHPSEQPLLNLAIVLMQKGEFDGALQLLNRAVAIAPHDPKIHQKLGQNYMDQNNLDQAQKELQIAIELAPTDASLHFLLGQAYRRGGMRDQAKAEFTLAASLLGKQSPLDKP